MGGVGGKIYARGEIEQIFECNFGVRLSNPTCLQRITGGTEEPEKLCPKEAHNYSETDRNSKNTLTMGRLFILTKVSSSWIRPSDLVNRFIIILIPADLFGFHAEADERNGGQAGSPAVRWFKVALPARQHQCVSS